MYHSVRISQAEDTWSNDSARISRLKAGKRERARRQREEYRQASEAKRAAGLTQHVVRDRREIAQNGWLSPPPKDNTWILSEVNGTIVVVRTKYITEARHWLPIRVSLPYLKFLDAGGG